MQKVLVFGQMSEFLSTVIKSSRANLWGKITSVFLNIIFLCKTVNFKGKKIEILWEILTFSNNCALLLKANILLENMLIFRKFWLFVWMSIYIKKLSNLIKTSIFLRKCLFVHVLIFIRVFLLLENCYFDSKYDFIRWYFGQKCHFSSKIYISGGINFLEKSRNFLRKGVNLAVNFGKNDNWY